MDPDLSDQWYSFHAIRQVLHVSFLDVACFVEVEICCFACMTISVNNELSQNMDGQFTCEHADSDVLFTTYTPAYISLDSPMEFPSS